MERYYLGSNTAKGFVSLYDRALRDMNHIVLLKGGPGTGKSTLMKKVAEEGVKRGYDIECWHCSGDPASLDGVYVKGLERVVVDATSPHAIEPKIPAVKESIVNLLDCVDRHKMAPYARHIEKLVDDKKRCFATAYEHLNIAFCYYKQIERTLIHGIDIKKMRLYARRVLEEIKVKNICAGQRKTGNERFQKAVTADGVTGFCDHLAGKEVCLLKGESATVHLFLGELTRECAPDTIIYDGFVGDAFEGIVVHDLAIVKDVGSVQPDRIIDLTQFEGEHRYQVGYSAMREEEEVASAVGHLQSAKAVHNDIEKYYVDAMDFDHLNQIVADVIRQIFA